MQHLVSVEREQFQEWSQHPVTLLLFRWCELQVKAAKDNWASGSFESVVENARAIGNVTAFGEILEIDETL